tara:strand:- start:88 stop:483 length:396 start_codon:yes stop_codon:yes gene_type:complete
MPQFILVDKLEEEEQVLSVEIPVVHQVHLILVILVVQGEQVEQVQFQVHQSQEAAVAVVVEKFLHQKVQLDKDHLDLEGRVVEEPQGHPLHLVDWMGQLIQVVVEQVKVIFLVVLLLEQVVLELLSLAKQQ